MRRLVPTAAIVVALVMGFSLWWPPRDEPDRNSDLGTALIGGAVIAAAMLYLERQFSYEAEQRNLRLQIGMQKDLSGIDLRKRDLSGFYLVSKNLKGAHPRGATIVMTTNETAFGEVLSAFMETRGLEPTREHMAELAEVAGVDPEAFLERTVNASGEPVGALTGIDEALRLSQREMLILALAYTLESGSAGDVYRELVNEVVIHLDLVASMDEEDHGGSVTAKRIREVLIPIVRSQAEKVRPA